MLAAFTALCSPVLLPVLREFCACGGAESGGVRLVYALGDASGGAMNANRRPSMPRLVRRVLPAPVLLLGDAETVGDEFWVVAVWSVQNEESEKE